MLTGNLETGPMPAFSSSAENKTALAFGPKREGLQRVEEIMWHKILSSCVGHATDWTNAASANHRHRLKLKGIHRFIVQSLV